MLTQGDDVEVHALAGRGWSIRYGSKGDWGNAGLAILSILPIGDALRLGKAGVKGAREAARVSEFVDLASAARREHILAGEIRADGTYGGGHRPGTGYPDETEFPPGWSDDKIMHYISDVATDPGSIAKPGHANGRTFLTGLREGVEIEVLLLDDEIWTAYPTNLPRNP